MRGEELLLQRDAGGLGPLALVKLALELLVRRRSSSRAASVARRSRICSSRRAFCVWSDFVMIRSETCVRTRATSSSGSKGLAT
jgi:hypothetical protein